MFGSNPVFFAQLIPSCGKYFVHVVLSLGDSFLLAVSFATLHLKQLQRYTPVNQNTRDPNIRKRRCVAPNPTLTNITLRVANDTDVILVRQLPPPEAQMSFQRQYARDHRTMLTGSSIATDVD